MKKILFVAAALLVFFMGCEPKSKATLVKFPKLSGPMAITTGPNEHLFASYYGINSWSPDQRYVTVLQSPIIYRLPTENDPAMLGLVDMESKEFITLAETRAWNFQQGCMAHWLGTFPNSRIIYNDMVDGKYASISMEVHTKRFRVGQKNYRRLGKGLLDYDGHGTFSPDGKWMVTDTYPSRDLYEQKLYLMDIKSEAVLPVGRYIHPPEFREAGKDAACDLHPRWNPNGDMVDLIQSPLDQGRCTLSNCSNEPRAILDI